MHDLTFIFFGEVAGVYFHYVHLACNNVNMDFDQIIVHIKSHLKINAKGIEMTRLSKSPKKLKSLLLSK